MRCLLIHLQKLLPKRIKFMILYSLVSKIIFTYRSLIRIKMGLYHRWIKGQVIWCCPQVMQVDLLLEHLVTCKVIHHWRFNSTVVLDPDRRWRHRWWSIMSSVKVSHSRWCNELIVIWSNVTVVYWVCSTTACFSRLFLGWVSLHVNKTLSNCSQLGWWLGSLASPMRTFLVGNSLQVVEMGMSSKKDSRIIFRRSNISYRLSSIENMFFK